MCRSAALAVEQVIDAESGRSREPRCVTRPAFRGVSLCTDVVRLWDAASAELSDARDHQDQRDHSQESVHGEHPPAPKDRRSVALNVRAENAMSCPDQSTLRAASGHDVSVKRSRWMGALVVAACAVAGVLTLAYRCSIAHPGDGPVDFAPTLAMGLLLFVAPLIVSALVVLDGQLKWTVLINVVCAAASVVLATRRPGNLVGIWFLALAVPAIAVMLVAAGITRSTAPTSPAVRTLER
jgi:hypothetical protein